MLKVNKIILFFIPISYLSILILTNIIIDPLIGNYMIPRERYGKLYEVPSIYKGTWKGDSIAGFDEHWVKINDSKFIEFISDGGEKTKDTCKIINISVSYSYHRKEGVSIYFWRLLPISLFGTQKIVLECKEKLHNIRHDTMETQYYALFEPIPYPEIKQRIRYEMDILDQVGDDYHVFNTFEKKINENCLLKYNCK